MSIVYVYDLVEPVEAEVVPVPVHNGQGLVHEGELLPRRDHLARNNFVRDYLGIFLIKIVQWNIKYSLTYFNGIFPSFYILYILVLKDPVSALDCGGITAEGGAALARDWAAHSRLWRLRRGDCCFLR